MNQSTNFGLKTTGDNDQWRDTLDYHNENMGKIDSVLDANQDALGIVVDGNKSAVTASVGQYIILRNSTISGKTDGLYTAAKPIPANTAIDGTYLTAVSGGGLNALNSNMLSYAIEQVPFYSCTLGTAKAIESKPYVRRGFAVGIFANYAESRFVIPFAVYIPANQAYVTVNQVVKAGAEQIITSGTFDFVFYLFRSNS